MATPRKGSPRLILQVVIPAQAGIHPHESLDSGLRPLSNGYGSGTSSPMLGRIAGVTDLGNPNLAAGNFFDGGNAQGAFAALDIAPTPKADAMDEFLEKNGVPKERLPEVKNRINNFWTILSGHASALGGQDLEFRLGEWWMTRQEEGQKTVVFIPVKEVLAHLDEPEVLVGAVTHEAGHVFETRWHKSPGFREELKKSPYPQAIHTLNNVLEDMAQEHSMKERWPGTEKYIQTLHKSYRGDFFADPNMPLPENLKKQIFDQDELKQTFPHEEYIDALRKFWMAGQFPENREIQNPAVSEALNQTRKAVEEVLRTTAPGHSPSEEEKIIFQERRLDLIREKILPEYLKLIELSKKRLEEEMKKTQKGRGQGEGSGGQSQGGDDSSGESTEQDQQSQGQGSSGQKSQDEKEAQKTIEERAQKIAKKLCPTDHNPQPGEEKGGKGGSPRSKEQESVPLNPSQWSETEAGQKAGEMKRQDSAPASGSTSAPSNGEVNPLEIAEKLIRGRDQIEKISSPQNAYEETLEDVSRLVDILSGRLENIFSKNDRFDWDNRNFKSGPSVNIKRWIKSEARGWRNQDDFKVFKRKRLPTKRDYKFSLLIDVSDSMAGERMRYALQTGVVFMEALERLGIDYSLFGFAEKVYPYKNFSPNATSPDTLSISEKNRLIEAVKHAGGGATWDTEAIATALQGDPKEGVAGLYDQPGERRILIVITDGEGNGAASNKMNEVLAQAKREGVEIIGVGVGEGMAYVKKRYPRYVLEPTMETAPQAIADILEREVENGFSEEENP